MARDEMVLIRVGPDLDKLKGCLGVKIRRIWRLSDHGEIREWDRLRMTPSF